MKVDGFVAEKNLQGNRTFVVEALEVRAEAGGNEAGVQSFERAEDARASAVEHRFHEDAVAIVLVEYKDVVVAATRCNNKPARGIGVDLARCRFEHGSKAVVGAVVGGVAGWESGL